MSYYGENLYDESEHLVAVGETKISDLTVCQQMYIAGMQYVYDSIEEEKEDYDFDGTVLDQITNEISFQALDMLKESVMSKMVEVVVSFAEENAELE